MVRNARSLVLTGLVSLVAVPRADAQTAALELEPFAGVYLPASDLVDEEGAGGGVVRVAQRNGLIYGARATLWMGGGVGLEGAVGVSGSDAEVTGLGTETSTASTVWTASGRLMLTVGLSGAPAWFHGGLGLALVGRSGEAFDPLEGSRDLGGVIDIGARFAASRWLAFRVDLEDYVYSSELARADGAGNRSEFAGRLQHDVVISAGLAIRLR